jgi:predicted Rossmann fold flavoprotein
MSQRFDVVVVGAGAAGLFCAGIAARRGLSVALFDHAHRLAEKIRISGGGRCNFTNLEADRPERFLGDDPSFARHALRAYRPRDFVALVSGAGIGWHEKHRGQLFCDDSSERIVELLRAECDRGGVAWRRPCPVREVRRVDRTGGVRFVLSTDAGEHACASLVVATGGLSIPKIGATDWGLRLARDLGLRVVEPRPALVPLTFTAQAWQPFAALAGLALEVEAGVPGVPGAPRFVEDLLFTHRGLSGPAVLQVSSYWREGGPLSIDLAPGRALAGALVAARDGARRQVGSVLAELVPKRLVQAWLAAADADAAAAPAPPRRAAPGAARPSPAPPAAAPARALAERRLAELGNREIAALAGRFHDWRVLPAGTEGWRKAEVMAGGVATGELDPATMGCRRLPGLAFIGEVVDVTGWLGGYNFQWAWASAWCAAHALGARVGAG